MSSPVASPAVFLDRDGTLIREIDYLADPNAVELLPGAAPAVRKLNAAGLPVVLVTNQSGLARGLLDESALQRIHARLDELLGEADAHLDLTLHCPHHPEHGQPPVLCACRKPEPGMLYTAAAQMALELPRSWMIGDACRDLQAGWRVGAQGLLVATGKGELEAAAARSACPPGCSMQEVPDLPAAVEHILDSQPTRKA